MEDSSPKIMFQQSHEPLTENPTHSSTPVTNIIKINFSGSHVKLEIQEILQLNTSGMKTTFVFVNEKEDCAETFFNSKCERTWIPYNESSEQPSQDVTNHNGNQNTNYRFTFGSMSEQTEAHSDSNSISLTKTWDNPNYSQCRSDYKQQISTDIMLANYPSSPPPLLNIKPQGKRKHFHKSFSSDQFWDIPPPRKFAEMKYNTLEDLTCALASCRIGVCSPADKQQRELTYITDNQESGCPCSVEAEERADLAPLFDQLSETDNYEPMLMIPSLSTNRSSFTKDFINCEKRKSWIRNNSTATVVHRACSLPKKRRQTFPGMSQGLGLMQEDFLLPYSESFSSVMTITVGALKQTFRQMDSILSLGSCMEKHFRTALEDACMSPLQDMDVHSLNTNEVTEGTEPKSFGEKTGNTSSSLSLMIEETNDLQLNTGRRGTDDSDKPAVTASCPAKGSTDTEIHSKEQLRKSEMADKQIVSRSTLEAKEHLKHVVHKDPDSSGSDHWAKRRKLFKESKQWSSAGGSSITSDITEETVSEDTRFVDMTVRDNEDRGFYTETFHSSAWIYQGDDVGSGAIPPSLNTRTRAVSIRERTVKISKGTGEYPWGFRIQFSKPIAVTEVDTNGAAEEAGLMVGDYVLAVNGTDVTSIPHSEAADLARQGPDVLTLTIGSDIARCPNTPRPACRGYLHKRTQSGLIKGWRKRWFVLTHDCCLYYYRHKRDEGKRRALSAVKLEGAEVGPDISLGKPFVFKCRPQFGNRVYFFCATSNQEMKRWLEVMEKAIHPITQNHVWVDVTRHNSNLPPLAVKNPECLGLLHKMDKNKDMWVQHYCILKDGCLSLYSGIRATHAHGGIYLQGYMVREQPYGSKKSTIELKPPSDEFKTFHLCAENPNENKRWIIAIKASIKKWLPLHQVLQDYMNQPPEETRM
ncbi:uncharacterized protein pdzph1 isoform X2 [Siniperca chuatsi]|nr:uncharacterized protein pdzph1 isoform X2 [Siniperca chuatsi]